MEPRKRKVYKYYAYRCGSGVVIMKTLDKISRIKSTVRLPKLSGSPRYLEDGRPNEGVVFTQMCYTGGTIVGVIPVNIYSNKVGYASVTVPTRLTVIQKRVVKALLESE